jgi:hypothetical protein
VLHPEPRKAFELEYEDMLLQPYHVGFETLLVQRQPTASSTNDDLIVPSEGAETVLFLRNLPG